MDFLYNCYKFKVNEEHMGMVMEAISHRQAEVTDMAPVAGNFGRTRMTLTCPSRSVSSFYQNVFFQKSDKKKLLTFFVNLRL